MNGVAGVANKNSLEISLTEFGLILLLKFCPINLTPNLIRNSEFEWNIETVKDNWFTSIVHNCKCSKNLLFPSSIFGWFSSCGGDTYNSMQFILHCQEFCKSLGRLRKKCYYYTEAFAASIERQKFFGKIHDSLARLYFIGLRGHTREAVFHVPYFFLFPTFGNPKRCFAWLIKTEIILIF